MSEQSIEVKGLSKRYEIGARSSSTLRGSLSNLFRPGNKKEIFWALKDIDFEIKKGEAIGIIGRNGAGKSTLLKILSKITSPTSGSAILNGRVASLLEVGTGFHPELTGRENVFLNGAILGMTRSEIRSKFDEIVDFSGVERFIDTPVKHYSSGMYLRLAFSVAAHLRTEILLVDEVLAVGDVEFQEKCVGKLNGISGEGKTVLFVSHNYPLVSSLCDRIISLTNGKIDAIYNSLDGMQKDEVNYPIRNQISTNFMSALLLKEMNEIGFEDEVKIEINAKIYNEPTFILSLIVKNENGQRVFISERVIYPERKASYLLSIAPGFFLDGQYFVDINIKHVSNKAFIEKNENALVFRITDRKSNYLSYESNKMGVVADPFKWI